MSTLLLRFNKPFGVLCQFTSDGGHPTLASFIKVPDVYPAGRLDTDSEGLLLLTDHGPWQARIADPQHRLVKTYWAQVEGIPDGAALHALRQGVALSDFTTRPAQARLIDEPAHLWPRTPPIRYRAHIPTSWLELQLTEGKNRQVRRMTAAVGHPTLRLIRAAIGPWTLDGLEPGQWEDIAWPADMLSSAANDSSAAEPHPQKQKTGMRSPQPRHHRSRTTPRT